jgi:hypothetical protein
MNDQTLRIIMWVGVILFSIIGFFITRYINRTSKKQDENSENIIKTQLLLTESINKLQLAISGLNGIILTIQQSNDIFSQSCNKTHTIVDKKLDDHDKMLNEHGKKIIELDFKTNKR